VFDDYTTLYSLSHVGVLLFFLISLLSFFQSTLSGGGASLLLMPLIAIILSGKFVAPIMTIGTSITGVSRIWMFRHHIDWGLVKWYILPSSIAAFLGAYTLILVAVEWIQVLIGFFLVVSIFQFRDKFLPKRFLSIEKDTTGLKEQEISKLSFIVIGTFVAFLSGLIGGVGPLMNGVYIKYGLNKERLLGTRTANEIFIHLVKLATYFSLGDYPFVVVFTGVIVGISGILGSYLAKSVLKKISSDWFTRIVLLTMVTSGIIMLWQNWNFLLTQIKKL
jgi:uncharacterized protein